MKQRKILIGVILFVIGFIGFLLVDKNSALVPIFFYLAILSILFILISVILKIAQKARKRPKKKRIPESQTQLILVKEKTTGKVVDKIEVEETTPGNRLTDELIRITGILKKQVENKYPSDKYEVFTTTAQEYEKLSKPQDSETFRMEASARSLFTVNFTAVVAGSVVLLFLLLLRQIFTLIVFIAGVIVLIVYMVADYAIWQKRGIRIIEVDKDGINLYRGKKKKLTGIDKSQITGINIFTKLNRRIVTILTGGEAIKSVPGITLFSGPRIRIADDSFNDKEFALFIEKIKQFNKTV